ncbi:MAG: CDP-diacylglycerol diphosphatase [Rhodospirillales bacterium]|nr:CDP-diacylglycerol diphosphatase [Rhodospirillales bacterium]
MARRVRLAFAREIKPVPTPARQRKRSLHAAVAVGPRGSCVRRAGVAAALLFAGLLAARAAEPASRHVNPDVLWHIVHDRCVPDLARFHTPLPCIKVDLHAGYALLKDLDGATQVLLIPTARVTGIEDPAVRAPGAPDYLQLAWASRGTVSALAGRALPRQDLALAVNSIAGRTQNQLHIHIDCIDPKVRGALAARLGAIGTRWARFPGTLPGGPYLVRRLNSPDLAGVNPFRLLAEQVPGAAAAMGRWTLGLAGVHLPHGGRAGFVLLAARTDPATGTVGAAERLLDHGCAVAHAAAEN